MRSRCVPTPRGFGSGCRVLGVADPSNTSLFGRFGHKFSTETPHDPQDNARFRSIAIACNFGRYLNRITLTPPMSTKSAPNGVGRLTALRLSGGRGSAPPPDAGKLTELNFLHITGLGLTGSIAAEFGSLSNLE